MATHNALRAEVYDRVARSQFFRDNLAGLTAHQRHQRLVAEALRSNGQQQGVGRADCVAACVGAG
jgi:hypothetical protein